jgi:hypothetical protein
VNVFIEFSTDHSLRCSVGSKGFSAGCSGEDTYSAVEHDDGANSQIHASYSRTNDRSYANLSLSLGRGRAAGQSC